MDIYSRIADLRQEVGQVKKTGQRIGFVPTMGSLHKGHLSLVSKAVQENDFVVVSIFVNPTQFGPKEDYDSYPRDLESDAAKLGALDVDCIFSPDTTEMYPEGYNSYVMVKGISEKLCGSSRPGHFKGVTTVVTKLFNIIQPNIAYFGEKDYQQLMVIKRMVKDLNMPIEIKGISIVREEDGLALSSRNKYLNIEERKQATILNRSLLKAKELILEKELKDVNKIKKEIVEMIERQPLAIIDYIEIVDLETLGDIQFIEDKVLVALAVYFGVTRLIDNIVININY